MASIDPTHSVFSQARSISIETPAGQESNWRSHVVARLAAVAKVAVVATTLALSASPSFGAEAQPAPTGGLTKTTVTAQDQNILNGYRAEMLSSRMADTWQTARPDLKIVNTFDGADHRDDRPLSAKAGVSFEGMDPLDAQRLKNVDHDFQDAGRSIPAISMSLPSAYFHADAKAKGDVCMVQVNANILQGHKDIAKHTGLADDVVRDYLLRHEMSHCVEQSDVNAKIVGALFKEKNDAVKLPASRQTGIDVVTPLRSTDADYVRQKIEIEAGNLNTHQNRRQSEEYADGLSLLSLVVEGRMNLVDVHRFVEHREQETAHDLNEVHRTSDFLRTLVDQLEKDPSILSSLKNEHAKNIESGKGLQIRSMESWMNKAWQSHADLPSEKADTPKAKEAHARAGAIVGGSLFAVLSTTAAPAKSATLRP